MTAGQYLFGFTGRVNRAKWWLLILIQMGAGIVYYIAMGLVGVSAFAAASGDWSGVGAGVVLFMLLTLAYCVLMFIWWLAVTVKRLHDRDKSGGWIWLFAVGPWACYLLAFIIGMASHSAGLGGLLALGGLGIGVWAFVELGCLRGTVGPNRYGPDPLAPLYQAPLPAQPA